MEKNLYHWNKRGPTMLRPKAKGYTYINFVCEQYIQSHYKQRMGLVYTTPVARHHDGWHDKVNDAWAWGILWSYTVQDIVYK